LVTPAEKEHGIQGIGDGGNYLVDTALVDHVESVATDDAIERAAKFARTHGILVGPSSGANILASERFIEKNNPSGILLTVLCDRGERYLEG
jgi:cysteine synthase A